MNKKGQLTQINSSKKTVNIRYSVTYIYIYVFYGCSFKHVFNYTRFVTNLKSLCPHLLVT